MLPGHLTPLRRGRSWAQDACSLADRSAVFFLRKIKLADEDSHSTDTSVWGALKKVILTTILLSYIRIFARLIWYLCVVFTHGLNCGLWAPDYRAEKIAQKCLEILLLSTICMFLHQTK